MDTNRLEERRVFFPQPHAQIPTIGEDGDVSLIKWGKRDASEDPEFDVPITGWARTSSNRYSGNSTNPQRFLSRP